MKNGKFIMKKVRFTLYCTNTSSVSVASRRVIKSRDSLFALAIALVGPSTILFGAAFPQFRSYKISKKDTEELINMTSSFKLKEEIGNQKVVLDVRKVI